MLNESGMGWLDWSVRVSFVGPLAPRPAGGVAAPPDPQRIEDGDFGLGVVGGGQGWMMNSFCSG